MRYEDLKQTFLEKWKNLNQGIPLNPEYTELRKVLPSWDVAESTLLLGSSGSGKTRLLFKIAVLDSLSYMIKNPTKMKVRILFNSLELTELDAYTMLICYLFKKNLNIDISREYLLNKLQKEEVDEELFNNLEKIKPAIEFFNSYVTVKDNIRTAEGWYLYCKKILDDAGTVNAEGKYVKKNPNLHFIIIVDTLNAISVPSGSTKLIEMTRYSAEYMKQKLRSFYGASCIQTQQLDKQSQQNVFSNKGERVESKFLPQASDAKDYKSSEDDNSLVLSIFLPHKFRLDKWEGFDVRQFKGKLTFLYVLKSNFTGTPIDKPIPFYVDHSNLIYQEIPSPTEHPILFSNFCKAKGIETKGKTTFNFSPEGGDLFQLNS